MDGYDSFENRLLAQKHATVPQSWRNDLLSVARNKAAIESHSRGSSANSVWTVLRHLLWPHPAAWAALSAIWVCALGLEISMAEPSTALRPHTAVATNSYQTRQMLLAQRRLFSELLADEPKRSISQDANEPEHHSRRREDAELA